MSDCKMYFEFAFNDTWSIYLNLYKFIIIVNLAYLPLF